MTDDEDADIADNQLLLVLLGLGLPMMLAFHVYASGRIRLLGVIAAVALMISFIPITMFRTLRLRRQVASRYGLQCPACGHNPGGLYALSTATVRRCRKCRARLFPSLPGDRRAR